MDPAVRTPRRPSARCQDENEVLLVERSVRKLTDNAPAGHDLEELCWSHSVVQCIKGPIRSARRFRPRCSCGSPAWLPLLLETRNRLPDLARSIGFSLRFQI